MSHLSKRQKHPVGDKYRLFQERARHPIEPFGTTNITKMTLTLYLNILDPQYTRYVQLRDDLEKYLIERFGGEIDFQITVSEPL
jgi:hypothetical protein